MKIVSYAWQLSLEELSPEDEKGFVQLEQFGATQLLAQATASQRRRSRPINPYYVEKAYIPFTYTSKWITEISTFQRLKAYARLGAMFHRLSENAAILMDVFLI